MTIASFIGRDVLAQLKNVMVIANILRDQSEYGTQNVLHEERFKVVKFNTGSRMRYGNSHDALLYARFRNRADNLFGDVYNFKLLTRLYRQRCINYFHVYLSLPTTLLYVYYHTQV